MRKRVLAVLLTAAMAVSALAGCGSKSADTKTDDTKAAETTTAASAGKNEMAVEGDDVTTLNVWTFIELHQQFYVDMAEKWNAENPDKKVKLVLSNMAYDDMHNKLSLALESGEGAPDIVDIELGKFPAFMTGKIGLMDLTSAIEPYRDTVVESRLDIYSKDGKIYGFPTHVGTTVAFYNEDLLNAAGVDYKSIKTWDDFKEAGVKYYEATGKYFACIETSAQWMINLMLAQKGGNYLDADGNVNITSDEMVEVLTYIKGMQDTGAFATVPGGQPDNEEAYPFYNSGDYAAQIMPFWQTSRYTNLSADASKEIWNVLGFDPVNTEVWTDTELTQNPDNQFVQYFTTYPFDVLNEVKDSIGLLTCFTDEKMPSINNEFCNVTLNSIYEDGMDIKEALTQSQETLDNEFR